MKLSIKAGSTSQSIYVWLADSSSTTGAGLTGLVYNSAGLTAHYVRVLDANTQISLATLASPVSAWSSGGFVEVNSTYCPGLYRLDLPNAAIAAGVRSVIVFFQGATNLAPLAIEIELTGWDNQDGVRGGMTALPNAAAEAAGGLFTRGIGPGQIDQETNGTISVNLKRIIGTALTETSNGNLANAFKKFFNVSIAAGTINSLPDAVPGASGGLLIAGSNAATTFNGLTTGALVAASVSVSGNVVFNADSELPFSFIDGSVVGGNLSLSAVTFSNNFTVAGAFTAAMGIAANITGNLSGSVGSVTAGVTLADGAITEAKISVPAEAAGRPTGILGMLRRAWEWTTNLVTRDRSTGIETLYGADNMTVLERRTQSTTGSVDQISKGQ